MVKIIIERQGDIPGSSRIVKIIHELVIVGVGRGGL